MKTIILGALLVGSMAGQSALAEVRTFDFTASINRLSATGTPFATSLQGIDAGTTVSLGETTTGTLSFDDLDTDFSAASSFSGWNNAIKFSYRFQNGSAVAVTPAVWGYTPGLFGTTDMFNVTGTTTDRQVASNLFLFTPHDAFSWEVGNGTSASLAVSWTGADSAPLSLNADLSSLVEVTPVPEPATYGMLLLGAAIVGGVGKRRAVRGLA